MEDALAQLPVSQRWRGQSHPVTVVAAIVRRAQDILLIRRRQPPYAGKWALVGGRWEFGETLPEALCREVWEETGLTAGPVRLCCFANERLFPYEAGDLGAHFAMFVFEVQAFSGEPGEQSEGPVAWFSQQAVDELHARQEIVPTDYRILRHCLNASQPLPYIEVEVVAQDSGTTASRVRRFETMT